MQVVKLLLTFVVLTDFGGAQTPPNPALRTLTIAPQITMRYSAPWKLSDVKYRNAQELLLVGQAPNAAQAVQARILLTTEQRTDQQDAQQRLQDIAHSRAGTVKFLVIGGWPAVELEFTENLAQRGAPQRDADLPPMNGPTPQVQRAIVAIAADTKVLHYDITLAPGVAASVLQQAEQLTTTSAFPTQGNPDDVQKAVQTMQQKMQVKPAAPPPAAENLVRPMALVSEGTPQGQKRSTGAATLESGVGELEIITSADASQIVVASNSALSYSSNTGGSFSKGNTGTFGLNDPTLARGASKNFYLGVIALPSGTKAQLNVSGCTNAVNQSTDGGANFALQGYSANCPQTGGGICFPDQPHIAADSVHAASGKDQIYGVWRNFTSSATPPPATCGGIGGGFEASSISCSQDNGATWTATAALSGAGDFPRVAVGADGNVYVATISGNNVLLNRLSSCSSGLNEAAGFPKTVATLTGTVACPVSGLDRCNNGNTLSSPTVAPDPNNASHILVSYAETDGSGGEQIVVSESFDSGASFPSHHTVSGGAGIRRFMPWSCSTNGRAYVGWYDRTSAKAAGATNDRTEYYVGSGTGTAAGSLFNLSNNPDPECASGWPCAPRSTNDSESCTVQPELAGVCQNSTGGGSQTRCDFSSTKCPTGETCQTGGGCPKYGDYNGMACSGNWIISAWTSATAPQGLPAVSGLSVFSSSLFVGSQGETIWNYTGTPCSGVYELHNTGKIWRYTGTACSGTSCPGWQLLDQNTAAVAIAASGSSLYELHNTGKIWRYTGTACSGTSCPGWQLLDQNTAAVGIVAGGSSLYELHNTGKIWRYTGTPCSGTSCPGWQLLDDNNLAVAIAAAGSQLYELHNDGSIWNFTGTACSGTSCPGWQKLDQNTAAVSILAAGSDLYQMHNDGSIWRYTGTACSGTSCPGWQRLDDNALAGRIAGADSLYQLHTDPLYEMHGDGSLWRYTGTDCDGEFCPGWEELDNNASAVAMAAAENQFYELHNDGSIWRHNGTPCSGSSCPGWIEVDNNTAASAIAAAGSQLFEFHKDGSVWRHNGTPCSGKSCPGWIELDNNSATTAIAAGGNQLFELHNDGSVWRHTGTPCSGSSCPGWEKLDSNSAITAIAAGPKELYELHNDGSIWRYTGTACSGTSCPGWQKLDTNAAATAIAAGGKELVQLHNDGSIWLYTGTPCSTATSCPGWQQLDKNTSTIQVVANGNHIYQRHNDGSLWRYTGTPCSGTSCPGWTEMDNNTSAIRMAAGGYN